MREVLIDVTRLVDRTLQGRLPTGVDRVNLAYVQHFADRAVALLRYAGRWIVFSCADSARLFAALLAPTGDFAWWVRWLVARNLMRLGDAKRLSGHILFNAGHSGLDHPDYALQIQRRGLTPVFFLHDLIPITHPEYCRAGEAERHQRRLETMLSVGRGLIVNSQATLDAAEDYGKRHGRKLPPHVIAPLAPPDLPAPAAFRPLKAPYFVILGTIEPRKNHLLLLHLWRNLALEQGDSAPWLVIIGQRGWECEQVVDLLERCEVLRKLVIELPRCSDADLSTYLHHAQALLFPSFEEGYGIPLVEALAVGVPVIASGLPVFREIAGEIPDYLDPLDGPGWQRLILDFASPDSERRADQLGRLAGFRAPSWESHFLKIDALLDEIDAHHS
jgi:glycosyltransferase involved in cell wall biosynthesis